MQHQKQWEFLKKKFEAGNLPHAYLFVGAENLGKKDFALKFAEFAGCKFPDLMAVGPEEGKEIPIAKIREIQNFLAYKSYYGGYKIVIVDQAHLMNQEAQSCFLKTLEEPKGQTLIVLVSSKPDLLLETIFSRCQTLKFFGKPQKSAEQIEKEKEILSGLLKVIPCSLAEKFKYTKNLDFEKQDLGQMLNVLQNHFREQMLSRVGTQDVQKLKNNLKLIEDINSKITFSNVNSKLALEILLLNL